MKFLLFVLLISVSSSVFALSSITGVWYGKGELKNRHRKIPCEIYMDVTQTDHTFSINEGGYICDDYKVEYPASSFEVRDNQLYYQDKLSGELVDGGITIFSEFEPGLWFYLTLKIGNSGLIYDERWEVEGSELYVFSNSLQLLTATP